MNKETKKVCLTIAGVDPSGGAGVIADIKTFTAFGCFATAAVSSITFQNTTGVFGALSQSADTVLQQVQPIFDDLSVAAVKSGMLPTSEVIQVVADLMIQKKVANFVVDPVVRSTSGFDLIDDVALRSLIANLFPIALLVTPNIPEAERITAIAIKNNQDIITAAEIMQKFGAKNVLIKGGHRINEDQEFAVDHLFSISGHSEYKSLYIETKGTHGTGCVLSAAITANLALGKLLDEAMQIAKDFVSNALLVSNELGGGNHPLNI